MTQYHPFTHSPDAAPEPRLGEWEHVVLGMLEASGDVLLCLDADGRIARMTGPGERLLGRARHEMVGAPLDVLPGELRPLGAALAEALAGRRELRTELFVSTPSPTWYQVHASPASPGMVVYLRDVSAGRWAREVLGESEECFRALIENTADIVTVIDRDGVIRYESPSVERILGWRPEELVGRHAVGLVHPDDLESVRRALLGRVHGVEGPPVEYRFRHRDGSWRYLESRSTNLLHDPSVRGMVATSRDVTDRRLAEEALRESEMRLRLILGQIPAILWTLGTDLRFELSTGKGLDLIGLAPNEVQGLLLYEFLGSDDPAHPDIAPQLRALAGEPSQYEGSWGKRIYDISVVPRRGPSGEVTGTISLALDITEEAERERRMRLLFAALESLDEAVSVFDGEGRYVYTNVAHARLFGYEPGTLPEGGTSMALPDDAAHSHLDEVMRTVRVTGSWVGTIYRSRLDTGEVLPLEVIVGRVEGEAREELYFSIARDVTDQLLRDEQLRRAERLASLGTLVGGVAHELNNPLTAVMNFARLMLLDPRPPEDQEALDIIYRESERAARIVSDLRVLARRSQDPAATREGVDLNDVVRHVLRTREHEQAAHDVHVREELAAALPPVSGNRGALEQVVLNLVVNAEHALAGVPPRRRRLVVRTRASRTGVELRVSDTGPGIPAENLQRIFDAFFTTKPPGQGTGLGLSLVHSIVADHGGKIAVESNAGRGAAFVVDLPRMHGPRPAAPEAEPTAPPRAALRVLVVDDEQAIRRSLNRYLTRLGHRVAEASDGNSALAQLREGTFDLILSDLRMPGLSGESLLSRLREEDSPMQDRIVFVTGAVDGPGAAHFLTSSAVRVLLKPFEFAELAALLEEVSPLD